MPFSDVIIQENISSNETEQRYLCRVARFTRQNLMLINPLNNYVTVRDTCLFNISQKMPICCLETTVWNKSSLDDLKATITAFIQFISSVQIALVFENNSGSSLHSAKGGHYHIIYTCHPYLRDRLSGKLVRRATTAGSLGSIPDNNRLEKRCLCPVQPRARRWWMGAKRRLTRGAAIDWPPCSMSCERSRVAPTIYKRQWLASHGQENGN